MQIWLLRSKIRDIFWLFSRSFEKTSSQISRITSTNIHIIHHSDTGITKNVGKHALNDVLSFIFIPFEHTVNVIRCQKLRVDIILKVSRNAIEIGIRWLTLSFNEPSILYLVLGVRNRYKLILLALIQLVQTWLELRIILRLDEPHACHLLKNLLSSITDVICSKW